MNDNEEQCIIFVKCIEGIDDFQFKVPLDTSIKTVKQQIREKLPPTVVPRASISSMGGIDINPYKNVKELYYGVTSNQESDFSKFLNLKINICLCGGKGGFGQLLKDKAHSMNKSKNRKNLQSRSKDLYKTLDGRRVKTIKKLKKLDEYMSTVDDNERSKIAEKRAKLQKILDVDLTKNVKFEDNKFLEDLDQQLEDIRESVNYIGSSSSDEVSSDEDLDEFSEYDNEEEGSDKDVKGGKEDDTDDDDDENDDYENDNDKSKSTKDKVISKSSNSSNRRSKFLDFFED